MLLPCLPVDVVKASSGSKSERTSSSSGCLELVEDFGFCDLVLVLLDLEDDLVEGLDLLGWALVGLKS